MKDVTEAKRQNYNKIMDREISKDNAQVIDLLLCVKEN